MYNALYEWIIIMFQMQMFINSRFDRDVGLIDFNRDMNTQNY